MKRLNIETNVDFPNFKVSFQCIFLGSDSGGSDAEKPLQWSNADLLQLAMTREMDV